MGSPAPASASSSGKLWRFTLGQRGLRNRRAHRSRLIAPSSISIARPEARPDAAELFFSSSGRLSRTPYLAGLGAVLAALWLYGRWVQGPARTASAWVVLPVLLVSGCCLTSRRLHDMGRAGWWSAYPLVLLILAWPNRHGDYRLICSAILAALSVWLCAMPGQRGPNRFGAALASTAP